YYKGVRRAQVSGGIKPAKSSDSPSAFDEFSVGIYDIIAIYECGSRSAKARNCVDRIKRCIRLECKIGRDTARYQRQWRDVVIEPPVHDRCLQKEVYPHHQRDERYDEHGHFKYGHKYDNNKNCSVSDTDEKADRSFYAYDIRSPVIAGRFESSRFLRLPANI